MRCITKRDVARKKMWPFRLAEMISFSENVSLSPFEASFCRFRSASESDRHLRPRIFFIEYTRVHEHQNYRAPRKKCCRAVTKICKSGLTLQLQPGDKRERSWCRLYGSRKRKNKKVKFDERDELAINGSSTCDKTNFANNRTILSHASVDFESYRGGPYGNFRANSFL